MKRQIGYQCKYCGKIVTEYLNFDHPLLRESTSIQCNYLKLKHTVRCDYEKQVGFVILRVKNRQINQLRYLINLYNKCDNNPDEILNIVEDIFVNNGRKQMML